ncbi:MAG: hypothetical protein L0Z07_08185, partial [Planctomycetes bacterium]|nr:hypothetical protein [Planctomycetota bacterium]
ESRDWECFCDAEINGQESRWIADKPPDQSHCKSAIGRVWPRASGDRGHPPTVSDIRQRS